MLQANPATANALPEIFVGGSATLGPVDRLS